MGKTSPGRALAQILKRQLHGVSKRCHAKEREGREAPELLLEAEAIAALVVATAQEDMQ